MKILVTGATGYIGKRLIPLLADEGHHIVCAVRDTLRAEKSYVEDEAIDVIEVDFLNTDTLDNIPEDIDVAFYLIHSMSNTSKDFETLEERCAVNFKNRIEQTKVKQVIYLSGITNEDELSKHLRSRQNVETQLESLWVPGARLLRSFVILLKNSPSWSLQNGYTPEHSLLQCAMF